MPHDTTPITAASKYPGCVERLRKSGCPNIARMAEIMRKPSDIDHALGATSAAAHWLAGRNGASNIMETAAGMWLALNDRADVQTKDAPEKEPTVFAVYCPADKAEKLAKIVAMFGCEYVEI